MLCGKSNNRELKIEKEMKKNEVIQEVLAAMKAMDILDRINIYLKKSGDMINKQELLDIMQSDGDTDEYYTQPDD